ncbi:hypothetical protein DID80_06740 [Candidatus Marinamargulisbacteria bacterium SCGC AAA071-K20]|nr:hypothetical protein DID80_06740 [Candidatus Marinamargulisbacteria bacterium SCGC AAA071-K20]
MLSNQPYKLSKLGFDDSKPWGDTPKASAFFPAFQHEFKTPTPVESVGEVFLFSPLNKAPGKSFITNAITTVDYFTHWHGLSDSQKEGVFDCGALTAGITKYDIVPLFAKVIFASGPLSIQLHDENHVEKGKFVSGKTEAWIALEDNVELIVGFKPGMKDPFMKEVDHFRSNYTTTQDIKAYFNFYTLNKGESYLISPGTVHAILKGTIYEIQQPCNITKRVLDIEKNQPRHCDFSLDDDRDLYLYNTYFDNLPTKYEPNKNGFYHFDTPYFATQQLSKSQPVCIKDSFSFIFCSDGALTINADGFSEILIKGEVLLIPANYNCSIDLTSTSLGYISYLPPHFKDPFAEE